MVTLDRPTHMRLLVQAALLSSETQALHKACDRMLVDLSAAGADATPLWDSVNDLLSHLDVAQMRLLEDMLDFPKDDVEPPTEPRGTVVLPRPRKALRRRVRR